MESVFEERHFAPFLNEIFNNLVVFGVSGFEASRIVQNEAVVVIGAELLFNCGVSRFRMRDFLLGKAVSVRNQDGGQ